MVESNAEEILRDANEENVAFLVVGDPFAWVFFIFSFSKCVVVVKLQLRDSRVFKINIFLFQINKKKTFIEQKKKTNNTN